MDTAFLHLQEDRRALYQQQELTRGLLSRCQGMVQTSCQDKEDMKARLEKALKDKEAVCDKLEATTAELVGALGKVKQLT
ncbi:hypothetical protein lerEdw1_015857 [Lerista edwardsae]|nr:hypothetical protein lerEdw1_015857 [Lerista edwardsae]